MAVSCGGLRKLKAIKVRRPRDLFKGAGISIRSSYPPLDDVYGSCHSVLEDASHKGAKVDNVVCWWRVSSDI